jgi:DNA-binding PadR family transcriptional regulator
MALRNVILGFLEEPASGYDIKQSFEHSLSHIWAAESSQIYGTLRAMEKEGLLASETEKSNRGPDRRVYRRTLQGDKALEEWLAGDPELSPERLSVLCQIHFLSRARDPRKTTVFLERVRDSFIERLREYEALRAEEGKAKEGTVDVFFDTLALDLGLKTLQARIEWCEEALSRLAALDGADPANA